MASTSTEVLVTSESKINSSCLPTSVRKASTADHSSSVTRCFSITWCKAASASGKTFCSLSLLTLVESTLVSPFPPCPHVPLWLRTFDTSNTVFWSMLHNLCISRCAKRGHLRGPARCSIRLPLPTSSSLRPFARDAPRLQCVGGDAVTPDGGEEVGVDLGGERDAVLAVLSHPLVRAVPGHRDPLETGGGRSLPRLPLLLVHAGDEFGDGHEGLDGDRREHVSDALGLWVVVHAGHLLPELRPGQDARQYVEHDGEARALRAAQRQHAALESLF